LINKII